MQGVPFSVDCKTNYILDITYQAQVEATIHVAGLLDYESDTKSYALTLQITVSIIKLYLNLASPCNDTNEEICTMGKQNKNICDSTYQRYPVVARLNFEFMGVQKYLQIWSQGRF